MTDLIHFLILIVSLVMLGVGLWIVHPAAMFIGLGSVLLSLIAYARWPRKRAAE